MYRSLPVIKPRRLRSGGTIGVITPGSPPISDESLQIGISYLEKNGFSVQVGSSVELKRGYLAGSDQDRVADIHKMFSDKDIDAIIAVRGGYGCTRLLPLIDFELIKRNPKIFIGYSDITTLHCALYTRVGLITFAGPMVAADFGQDIDSETESFFWSLIMDGTYNQDLAFSNPVHSLSVNREFTGPVLGGNLSIINSLLGTPYIPDLTGAVLAIEEIGEAQYRIDRMLNQLKLNNIFSNLSGIILGQFTKCEQENDRPTLTLDEVFSDYFASLPVSVIKSVPFGHELPKITLPMGAFLKYDPERSSLSLVESPVQ